MTIAPVGASTAGDSTRARPGLWGRLGLRARITLLFGLGAFLLSVSMGGLSYFTARHFLISDRQNASLREAYGNAVLLRSALQLGNTQYDALLISLETQSGSRSVLYVHARAYSSPLSATGAIPAAMLKLVRSGTPATQNLVLNASPQIVVGVPIPSVGASYFEIFDVSDLAHTLRVLALTLAAAGIITTLLGAALGRSGSGRSLRPLTGVSRVAVAIAGGQLETRLPAVSDDPDLAGLTASFNRMVDQLQERIQREQRFASDVSHELRSPLTTLSATLGVLEADQDQLTDRSRAALSLLGGDLRRFQRMVGDLLELSRTDTGSADVSPEEVEAGELIRRAVSSSLRGLPPTLSPPEVTIADAVGGSRLSVDKRRFERVMANLLENAALYGGGATRVSAEPGPQRNGGRTIWVAVEDRGPGLEPSERSKVFERFYRGHASGRRGTGTGTGLGLALVAEHVRLNGGTVWADQSEGGGARFVIELPIQEEVPV